MHRFNENTILIMEKTIHIAKSVLSKMFKIHPCHFEKNISRSTNVVEARRFLIYYLVKECDIRYLHIKRFIPALDNHATAIHHFKKMENLMDVEWQTRSMYESFRMKMNNEGHTHLLKDYTEAVKELKMVQVRLDTLKKMI